MLRQLDHTADAGFELFCESPEEVFLEAAYAMLDILYDKDKVASEKTIKLEIKSTAYDLLLHDFLSELIQLTLYEHFAIREIRIDKIDEKAIETRLIGEPVDTQKHEFKSEIKAVTYHLLCFEPRGDKWFGRVIFDL